MCNTCHNVKIRHTFFDRRLLKHLNISYKNVDMPLHMCGHTLHLTYNGLFQEASWTLEHEDK